MIRGRMSSDDVYTFKRYEVDSNNRVIGMYMISEKTGKEVYFPNNSYIPNEEDIKYFRELTKNVSELESFISVIGGYNNLEDWQKDIINKEIV